MTAGIQLRNGLSRFSCIALSIALSLIAGACHKAKNYSWQQVLRTVGCDPRTAQAKSQLGDCPKVADPQRPTSEEVQEFINYMNRKDALEGTLASGELQAPGCLQWRVDSATGQPTVERTSKKEGCSNAEQLKNYKLP